jgi:hypothetical protein
MGNSPWLYEALYVSKVINEIKKLRSRLTQMSESVTVLLHMLLVILKVGVNLFFPYFVLLEILLRWEWTHSFLTLCVDWNSVKPLNARLHQFNLLSLNSCYLVLLSCKAHFVFWTMDQWENSLNCGWWDLGYEMQWHTRILNCSRSNLTSFPEGHGEPVPTKCTIHPLDACYYSVVDEPQLS